MLADYGFFPQNNFSSINCHGRLLSLKTPQVMGILNVAAESFCSVGRHVARDIAVRHAVTMVEQGASIIDVGGEPTNPNVTQFSLSTDEEMERVIPVIELLAKEVDAVISVDTSNPAVMRAAVAHGAGMINDVRGLRASDALQVVASLAVPVVIMHMSYPAGIEQTHQPEKSTVDLTDHIKLFFRERMAMAHAAGILSENIILDPGFGGGSFGKSTQQNLQLLNRLHELQAFATPILVGLSRKLFIGDILKQKAEARLYGSLAVALLAALQGANIVRVHDVKPTVEMITMLTAVRAQGEKDYENTR